MSLKYRPDGSLAFTYPFTPEEQVTVDAWRRNLRLKMAREAFERARDRLTEMRILECERRREEEILN